MNGKQCVVRSETGNFRETILKRAEKDASFRSEMLIEAVNELRAGDLNCAEH